MAGFIQREKFSLNLDPVCKFYMYTSNKNIHFEMILDVGIGEKRKETRFLI